MKSNNFDELSLELTHEAYDDLINIQNYTYRQFGEAQWRKDTNIIDQGFKFIIANPLAGFKRADIPNDYLSFPIGEHIVIYRIEISVIYVIRVLHSKMNFRHNI